MQQWPKTRVTLLGRLADPQDKDAWNEFIALYGPSIFNFARRRLPQEEDAADVMQEVLSAVLRGTYQQLAAKGLIAWETAQDIAAISKIKRHCASAYRMIRRYLPTDPFSRRPAGIVHPSYQFHAGLGASSDDPDF